ncbi:MAG: coiled-coil domain-containing protein [Moorellales bacterium]
MVMVEDETKKQVAAGSEEQGFTFRTSFDPFNLIMQQLARLDDKLGRLDEKLDARIDKLNARIDKLDVRIDKLDARIDKLDAKIEDLRKETDAKIQRLEARIDRLDVKTEALHQELHNTTRWIIGTIVAVAGVAVALASWLFS